MSQKSSIQNSYAQLNETLNLIPDLIFRFNTDGVLIYVNEAYATFYNRTVEELIGTKWVEHLQKKAQEQVTRAYLNLSEEHPIETIELEHKTTAGGTIWYEWSFQAAVNNNGTSQNYLSIGRDITKRKMMEDELTDKNSQFQQAEEVAKLGSWHLDIPTNTLTWSPEVYRIFGMEKGIHLTYESFLDRTHEDDRAYVDQEWSNAMEGQRYDIEHRIVVNGEIKWLHEKALLEFDHEGKPLSGIVQDITDQKKTEKTIRELDALKTRFISALTHVTQAPLEHIRLSVDSILSEELANVHDHHKPLLFEIKNSTKEITTLITTMNTVLDIERNTVSLTKTATSLNSLTKSVLKTHVTHFKTKNINVKTRVNENLPNVMVDRTYVSLAIDALIDNALHYTEADGSVELNVIQLKNNLRISITDTGIGIPKAEQTEIFNRFFRASNANELHPHGVGLGLYLAKHIIDKHNGHIGFKSTEGKGSTFWIELPIT